MLAAVKESPFCLDEVTEAYGISRNHLAKVIHRLGLLGYLKTRRGRGGGIELARSPNTILLGKLVRELEDPRPLVECFDAATNTCKLDGHCRLKGVLRQAISAFYSTLDGYTLADITEGSSGKKLAKILLRPKPPIG